ncbi:F-box/LRR-repeat protein 2 [Frankliniella fusca]|uniref:F-box/LRR-repeat protein 2 n=1 Tax=Frankliniella fusca TaxID=407009 RepID=A0AAE1LDR4_9NEOP|nr:F-box/LRR-repeat protein 2 [Frankliniella fusca]
MNTNKKISLNRISSFVLLCLATQTIECLPEELLLHVFSLLPLEDLVCRVSRVCDVWHRLVYDDSLWLGAELRYTRDTQDDFIEVLHRAPSLRYLDYSGYTCDMPAEVAAALSGGVSRVRELYLQTTSQIDGRVIEQILLHFKDHLETLTLFVNSNLAGCSFKQESERAGPHPQGAAGGAVQDLEFLSAVGALRALRTLVLKGAWRCLSTHADVGAGCPALRELDISGLSTDFFDEHECPFFVLLLRHKRRHLEAIRLNGCYMHPSLLMEVSQLQVLRSITTPLATLSVIEDIESLEVLHIQGMGRRGDFITMQLDVAAFMLTCPRFGTIKELILEDVNDYSNSMAPALAASCVRLERLRVSAGTWLDALGLSALVRSLHALRRLDLRGCTTLGLRHLQVLPRHLPHLQLIDVRGCFRGRGVPPGVLRRLRRGLPQLTIVCDPRPARSAMTSREEETSCYSSSLTQVATDLSSTESESSDEE